MPSFFVGWFWYLGMLVPAIGLVQVGQQAMADRYTYLPTIGIAIALVWGIWQFCDANRNRQRAFGVVAVVVILCLMGVAFKQVSYWRDSKTLWSHSLDCDPNDAYAHGSLGMALHEAGQIEDAKIHYEASLRIRPDCSVYNNLGGLLASRGNADLAMKCFQNAVAMTPDDANAQTNLGHILADRGKHEEAAVHFRKALQTEPNSADVCRQLANSLQRCHKDREAADAWRKAIALQPENIVSVHRLAWLLATSPEKDARNGKEALELARWADQLSNGNSAVAMGDLAAAYAEVEKFHLAIETATKALARAKQVGNKDLIEALEKQLKTYQGHSPYREP
jgi:tetratricopeptide (TPR) repeat protein